jgi:hypothetical protein
VREALLRVAPRWVAGDPVDEVRSLGCILVPTDGMALFLFRGPSEDLIRERSTIAEVPFDRIVESIDVGFAEASDPA